MGRIRASLLAGVVLCACRGAVPSPETLAAGLDPLDRAAIGALAREACPRVLTRTFPLDDARGDTTTGKLWVRHCAARAAPNVLDIDLDVLGWQWVGEGSWGFDVREYVYFDASVRASLHTSVETEGGAPKLRVWSDAPPSVTVREIGRVSARARGPASGLLGVASGVFGQGPNVLATAALRERVRDLIRERATGGLVIALGDTPAPGAPERVRGELLREKEALYPGGALISGSFPAHAPATLRFDVAADGTALARAVCVDDALALVDAVIADAPHEARPAPADVLTLHGRGEARIPPRDCAWVLVTGARDDLPVVASLTLERSREARRPASRRWVRATLLAYDVDGGGAGLFGFRTGREGAPRLLGRPLTSARSPSVWLVADPVELEAGRPLVVEVSAWKPRARSFWRAETLYDETPLGRAAIVPAGDREERRVPLERAGVRVGWVDLALEAVGAE